MIPHDTIAALATAAGEAGVAVVRISGPEAYAIFQKLFSPAGFPARTKLLEPRRLYYGKLICPTTQALLDECLAAWMQAPRSFTGEEVIELHLHGGRLIVVEVLRAIYALGARPANAGEFTQRAFLNGKIDLTQAEAVADMIAAKSSRALKLAQAQWQGELSGPVASLRKTILELLVQFEAAVDFPEEEIDIIDYEQSLALLEGARAQISGWMKDYEIGRLLREGVAAAFIGKPNVGKSSLLNALLKEEAAIVHDAPGTTRDAIVRELNLAGLRISLVDTAGIRNNAEEVEQKGIQISEGWIKKAELVLVLLDTSHPLEEADAEVFKKTLGKKTIVLLNKTDLNPAWDEITLKQWIQNLGPSPHDLPPLLKISAKTALGIDQLGELIAKLVGIEALEKTEHLLFNQLRHRIALEKALTLLDSAKAGLVSHLSPELLATDLQLAARALGELIGELHHEHVLDEIFSRFCIGK